MGDASKSGFGIVETRSSKAEIMAEIRSTDSYRWQCEVEKLNDAGVVDAAFVNRGQTGKKGRGLLHVGSPKALCTLFSRAQGRWWSDSAGGGEGRLGNLAKKDALQKLVKRVATGKIFFAIIELRRPTSPITAVVEIARACLTIGVGFLIIIPTGDDAWNSKEVKELRNDFRTKTTVNDEGAWDDFETRRSRHWLTTLSSLIRLAKRRRSDAAEGEGEADLEKAAGSPCRFWEEAVVLQLERACDERRLFLGKPLDSEPTRTKIQSLKRPDWEDIGRWKLQMKGKWETEEDIAVQELRTLTLVGRHIARDHWNWFTRSLAISDSVSAIGAAQKGRSSVFPMLRLCRRLLSVAVGVGIRLVPRWIRSERDFSDNHSRGGDVGVAAETQAAHGDKALAV